MTIELENFLQKEANKNKALTFIELHSSKALEYRNLLRDIIRKEDPVKIWELRERTTPQQFEDLTFLVNHLTKTFAYETISVNGKIKMKAHMLNAKVQTCAEQTYPLSNEVYGRSTKAHIYELAKDKDMYIGVMGGFTNHLQLLQHILKENPKMEVKFVDVCGRQIVYNMLLAIQFNNSNKYQVAVYKKEYGVTYYAGSKPRALFNLNAEIYNTGLANFLKNEINEETVAFIHASNAINTYYYRDKGSLFVDHYFYSPESPKAILNAFLENKNILPGSIMMVVHMSYDGRFRHTPDDAVFIEKKKNGFTTYVYTTKENKTKIWHLKEIVDGSEDSG